ILLGTGAGTFTKAADIPVGKNPISLAVGDFNGDSRLDLAVVNRGSATVSIRLGAGAGGFTTTPDVPVGNLPVFVAVAALHRARTPRQHPGVAPPHPLPHPGAAAGTATPAADRSRAVPQKRGGQGARARRVQRGTARRADALQGVPRAPTPSTTGRQRRRHAGPDRACGPPRQAQAEGLRRPHPRPAGARPRLTDDPAHPHLSPDGDSTMTCLCVPRGPRTPARPRHRYRPALEQLEDRRVPCGSPTRPPSPSATTIRIRRRLRRTPRPSRSRGWPGRSAR